MTEAGLLQILARGEDSHHQLKRDATNADGLAAESSAWLKIDLLGKREANQCKAVVWPVAAQQSNLPVSDPVNDSVIDPVVQMLVLLLEGPLSTSALMDALSLKHRHSFRSHYLRVALADKWILPTLPNKSNSRLQRYQLTQRGRDHINNKNKGGSPCD